MMAYLLSGDIGGTKTLLQLTVAATGQVVLQQSYASAAYASLRDIVEIFLAVAGQRDIAAVCFALAGPVNGRVVKLTNLPWSVDADEIARHFGIRQVVLINDFEAVGHGIATLQAADLLTLQAGKEQKNATRLVIGAGTGLGVAWMSWMADQYQVHPSEAGHMDFAPTDELQIKLLRYLQQRYGHVSYERIVSGPGLVAIYEFLRDAERALPSAELLAALAQEDDAAAVIARFAQRGDEHIARISVELFLSVYGAIVGNMALAVLPRGGIYIAGGIAAKITAQMQAGNFMRAFGDKGRFSGMLQQLPVHIVLNPDTGLQGAALIARRYA